MSSGVEQLPHQILAAYPDVQFSLEQGTTSWTDYEFISYSLQFFQEFRRQVHNPTTGVEVPISYVNLDLHLTGDIRKPPTALYTTNGISGTVNKALKAFNDAGVKVAVNLNAAPSSGETQAQVIERIHRLRTQTIGSGLPFDPISIQPFAVAHHYKWVMNNLPASSPSALIWLLHQQY